MRYIKKEISKELFDKANEIGYPGMKELFDIPIEWWCGYGYYGCAVHHDIDAGKYFVIHTIGDSCD